MDFQTHSFKHAETVLNVEQFSKKYNELLEIITSIYDDDIIFDFNTSERTAKSISEVINKSLTQNLIKL